MDELFTRLKHAVRARMRLFTESDHLAGKKPSSQGSPRLVLFQLLKLYLPIAIFCIIGTGFLYRSMVQSDLKEVRYSESVAVGLGIRAGLSSITDELRSITYDLSILASEDVLVNLISRETPAAVSHIQNEWMKYSLIKKTFDQIRWIDLNGQERIRVNFNNGTPAVVPKNQLQNKRHRYYFSKTIKLNRGEFFISALDLNIEDGKIEQPAKPMIRISTQVFDPSGNMKGIIVLNYLAAQLLEKFNNIMSTAKSQVWLINQDGYWLKGPSTDLEWGFMYQRPSSAMTQLYPTEWEQILAHKSGQFEDELGLWTYSTVFPVLEGQKTSAESGKRFEPSLSEL